MHLVIGPLALAEAAMLAGVMTLLTIRHRRAVREPLHRVESGSGPRVVFLHGLGVEIGAAVLAGLALVQAEEDVVLVVAAHAMR